MGVIMKMTLDEIKEYVNQIHKERLEDRGIRFYSPDWQNGHEFEYLLDIVKREGGEGEGEYYEIVYSVKREGYEEQFLMFQGYYDSWNGVDWGNYDNPQLCEPREVTIIQYFPVKTS